MKILITNDDGIDSYGLKLLESLAKTLTNNITTVAPRDNRSGTSQAISLQEELYFSNVSANRYICSGNPADCVMLALNLLFKDYPPDLVLSGINHGMNASDDVGYSGTVGAAREASIVGIRAIAFSQRYGKLETDFEVARKFGKQVLDNALSVKLPPRHVLNVNFPSVDVSKVRGIRAAVLDSHKMSDQIFASKNPNFYSIGPINQRLETNPKSDRFYLENGYVTFTPLLIDTTAMDLMKKIPNFTL